MVTIRKQVLKKWIRVAKENVELHNFNGGVPKLSHNRTMAGFSLDFRWMADLCVIAKHISCRVLATTVIKLR